MSRMQTINPYKLDAKYISTECSPRHIQSVIEDLVQVIKKQDELANNVLCLENQSNLSDARVIAKLLILAKDITWR